MKDLSIIIVSYNTKELLKQCLQSVFEDLKRSTISTEVIVVDNGSNDGSVEMVKRLTGLKAKEVKAKAIENKDNVGFARANNQGAKIASGRHILFLNSDTIVGPHTLQTMVEFMDQHSNVGIASCQLRNIDGSIQPQGGSLPRLSTVAIWAFFLDDIPILHNILPSYQLRRESFFVGFPKCIGWVSGAAMWVRHEAWEKLRGFDEEIFMYGEDVDLCYRVHKADFDVMINPEVSVMHKGHGSGGGVGWVTGEVRGLRRLFEKQKPNWEMPLIKTILFLGMSLRWFIFGILKQNEALKHAYAQAAHMAG